MGAAAIGLQAAGGLMSAYGAAAEGDAALAAGAVNAQNAEFAARQAKVRAAEDEKRFMSTFRREQAENVLGVAASGIKMEGSPLAVLRDNARNAEADAAGIRAGALTEQQTYARRASQARRRGKEGSRSANLGAAASLLSAAGGTASAIDNLGSG